MGILYAVMFLLWVGICYLIIFITSNLPGMHGVVHVNRSSGNATIYRLLDGIPHVHADSQGMGYYGIGFGMATDRMFQMDKLRRLAQGRLSEIFGENALSIDKAMRNYGLEHVAKLLYQNIRNETRSYLDDYAQGVNDYINLFSESIEYSFLNTDYIEWKPEDSISVYLISVFSLAHSDELYRDFLYSKLEDEELVEKILPLHPDDEVEHSTSALSDDELEQAGLYKKNGFKRDEIPKRKVYEFIEQNLDEELKLLDELKDIYSTGVGASNCWAVSGEHTKSGKPILVNDPHLDPHIPSPFYVAELNVKDEYMIGAMLPGMPAFVSLKSKYISVGITSLNNDVIDLFEEITNSTHYLFKDKWLPMDIREEVINVKDKDPVTIVVRSTHHGPILDHSGSIMNAIDSVYPPLKTKASIAYSWIGYNIFENGEFQRPSFESFNDIFYAKTVKEVIDAVTNSSESVFGLCIADSQGNIGYVASSVQPKRPDLFAASRGIKEGWTGKHDWKGRTDPKDIPSIINPKKGYVFSANGRVSSLNVEAGIGAFQPATARAARINYLLNDLLNVKKQKVDANDMKKILNDTFDLFASLKIPLMIELVEKDSALERYIPDKKALKQIKSWLKQLKNWDYDFDKERSEPTLFTLWEIYFIDSLFKPQIENDYLRSHGSMQYGYSDFLVKLYRQLAKDNSHMSKYCQTNSTTSPGGCTKSLVDGLLFVYDYLVPKGTTFRDEDAKYKNWHKIHYRSTPFTKTFFKYFFDRSDEHSGSMHTINVGSVYYSDFKTRGLESRHTANYRMIVDFGKLEDNQYSLDTGISENILGRYFYYNLHDNHMSLEMLPMSYNSLNTTHTHRWSTMRLIYKDWYDQEEARLKLLEEQKKAASDAQTATNQKKTEDL